MTPNLPDKYKRGRSTPAVSKRARATFLEALGAGYTVTHAAECAAVERRRFYELRERDQGFADDWADAHEQGIDVRRDEAFRRAVEGWDEPLVSAGKIVGVKRVYSDRLLELLLKRDDPLFRDRPLDAQVAISAAVEVKVQRGPQGITIAEALDWAVEKGMLELSVLSHAKLGIVEPLLDWAATKPIDVQERIHEAIAAATSRPELPPPDADEVEDAEYEVLDDAEGSA